MSWGNGKCGRRVVTPHDPQAAEQARLAEQYEAGVEKQRGQRDGVVVTPVPIVDFIIRATRDIVREKWGVELDDDAVALLEDPFAGTGIFGARMLQTCPPEQVTALAAKLRCFEIDQDAADTAEHNLRRIIYARGGLPPLGRRIVECRDTFTVDPQERPSA